MRPAKGHQTESVRAQIKKWGKVARGVTAKGRKTRIKCIHKLQSHLLSLYRYNFCRQWRCIIENNNRQTDHNVSRRVTVNEQYAYMSTAGTNMATMRTFESYIGLIYNITSI